MIYLQLFLTFLEIGTVSFGGGYGMIALVREKVLSFGWLSEEEFLNMIAVSESTPGPIAVNMATFVGSSEGGFLGAALATLGVVLPAFCIILLVSVLAKKLLQAKGTQAVLQGVRPCIVALILATAFVMMLRSFFSLETLSSEFFIEWKAIAIFAILAGTAFLFQKWRKKSLSPILLIVLSAGLGILFYGL